MKFHLSQLPNQIRRTLMGKLDEIDAVIHTIEDNTPMVIVEFNSGVGYEYKWQGEAGKKSWQFCGEVELV